MSGTRRFGVTPSPVGASRPARIERDLSRYTAADFVEPDGPLQVTSTPMHGTNDTLARYSVSEHKWVEVVIKPSSARYVWNHGRWFDSQADAALWLDEALRANRRTERRPNEALPGSPLVDQGRHR